MPSAKSWPYYLDVNVPTHWPSRIMNHSFRQYALRIFCEASLGWMPMFADEINKFGSGDGLVLASNKP